MKQTRILSLRGITAAGVAYLYAPVLLFLLGWVRPLVSIPLLAASGAGVWLSLRGLWRASEEKRLPFRLGGALGVLFGFFLFFVIAGHSDLFAQDFDWNKHHAIFRDLLTHPWPVVYADGSLLTYYLGQYLVPAFAGKLFSSEAVLRWTIPLWNALGLTLVFYALVWFLGVETQRGKALIFFFMLFWSGATGLGRFLYIYKMYHFVSFIPDSFKWIDIFHIRIHFAPNYDALHDAFQHVISPWVAAALFLCMPRRRECYVLLALPLILAATLGFLYFALLLLLVFLVDLFREPWREVLKSAFGAGNLLLLPLACVLLVYLAGNAMGEKPASVGFFLYNIWDIRIFYLVFVCVEFLGYAFFLFADNKRNALFYLIVLELLLIPVFSLGQWNDLCSRGSIPARFILMALCLQYYCGRPKKNWRWWGLTALLLLAVLTPALQFTTHMRSSWVSRHDGSCIADNYRTLEGFAANPDIREDEAYNYFTLDYEHSPFYLIARRP